LLLATKGFFCDSLADLAFALEGEFVVFHGEAVWGQARQIAGAGVHVKDFLALQALAVVEVRVARLKPVFKTHKPTFVANCVFHY
jgi:hypothetical protein